MVAMKTGDDALSRLEKSVTAYEQTTKVKAPKKAGFFGLRGRASPIEKTHAQKESALKKSEPKAIEDLVTDMDTAFQAALQDAETETKTTGKTDKFKKVFAQHKRIQTLASGNAAPVAAKSRRVFSFFSKQTATAPAIPQGLTTLAEMMPQKLI